MPRFYLFFLCVFLLIPDLYAAGDAPFFPIPSESLEQIDNLPPGPLAVISGAGISGLAAAFELRAQGYEVVVVEKREFFSRFNIINLNIEVQVFLKKFGLLEEFEKFVAARILEHKTVLITKDGAEVLDISHVSDLKLDPSFAFKSKNFSQLFRKDGVYSVQIAVLLDFLAKKARDIGVHIISDAEVDILETSPAGGVQTLGITAKKHQIQTVTLHPDLFFIAEGAHSSTAYSLGFNTTTISNECSNESWVYGNFDYSGDHTFVISFVDASQGNLRIANIIFNAQKKLANVAVTADATITSEDIRKLLESVAQQAFHIAELPFDPRSLVTASRPVRIENQIATEFSRDNIYLLGDTVFHSSPLAGLGGTLALTLVPHTVSVLLQTLAGSPEDAKETFRRYSEAYAHRWLEKSVHVKKIILGLYEQKREKIRTQDDELADELGISVNDLPLLRDLQRDVELGSLTPVAFLRTLPSAFLVFLFTVGVVDQRKML